MQGAADATQLEVLHSAVNPMMPAAANPQVPQPVNPQVPSAAVPEEKRGPVVPDHAASAPLGTGSSAQSNPPVTIHRQLLSRLLRALPIASEGQLQSMLNVFDPRATPPPAAPFPNPPQDARPVHPIHPGGIPQGGVQSNDPLQHLLPQPTRKRSELPTPTPTPRPPNTCSVVFVHVSHLYVPSAQDILTTLEFSPTGSANTPSERRNSAIPISDVTFI